MGRDGDPARGEGDNPRLGTSENVRASGLKTGHVILYKRK